MELSLEVVDTHRYSDQIQKRSLQFTLQTISELISQEMEQTPPSEKQILSAIFLNSKKKERKYYAKKVEALASPIMPVENIQRRAVHARQCNSIFKISFFQGGNSSRSPSSSTGTKGPMTGITWQLLTDPIQEHDIKVESLPLPSVLFADLK